MKSWASDDLTDHWRRDTPIHRLNAGVKTAVTLAFIIAVVSFPKYALAPLCPYFAYPMLLITLGEVPIRPLLKRLLLVSPFAVLVGMFNPLIDRAAIELLPGWEIAGGWISFLSILFRFALTVSATIALMATTPFHRVCTSLRSAGVPRALVAQLALLGRYLAVLASEAAAMLRARALRAPGKRGLELRVAASMLATLFIRTVERGERVFHAMSARGFTGDLKLLGTPAPRPADLFFALASVGLFVALRISPAVYWLGHGPMVGS